MPRSHFFGSQPTVLYNAGRTKRRITVDALAKIEVVIRKIATGMT